MTQEQWDKLRECKTPEDILALAQAEGIELTDDELQQVTGGSDGYVVGGSIWGDGPQYVAWCPYCGQKYYFIDPDDPVDWCPHCAAKLR
ncbi:MAG: bacteriocin [Atopobiaceae bacterium]|nr:bacteriocin [Atopobiaceae bacterium]